MPAHRASMVSGSSSPSSTTLKLRRATAAGECKSCLRSDDMRSRGGLLRAKLPNAVVTDQQSRRLAAILAADIAGYSALMGADEVATVNDLKAHQAVVLPMIASHSGRIIDTAGDGIMAEFASVLNAVRCAVAIQNVMAERNASVEPARRMQYRIGINLGDVVFDEIRIYGDGINIAARLESIAEPGCICISGKVYEEINGRIEVACQDIGEQQLKNIARPVRIYRVNPSRATVASIPTPAPLLPEKPSIAVLPFVNLSGDREQDYFADGVTEDIITGLARARWLFVIARNSSFAYKGRPSDVKQVAHELGVRYVLEGSVRKAGERVRVSAQLVEGTSGRQLWAKRHDRELSDIFALQDEITETIIGAVEPELGKVERRRSAAKRPDSLDAWDLYQRGMSHLYQYTKDDLQQAQQYLHRRSPGTRSSGPHIPASPRPTTTRVSTASQIPFRTTAKRRSHPRCGRSRSTPRMLARTVRWGEPTTCAANMTPRRAS